MNAPRLIEVELSVTDVERSAAFYRDVIGVPLEGHAHAEGDPVHHHASWGDWEAGDGGFLMFSIFAAASGEATRSSIGFTVDDLDAVHARMESAGVKVVHSPTTRPWGRSATYQDTDGNTVSLTQS